MEIRLYHNNSLSNVVFKNISLVATTTSVKFLEPYDEYSPVIRYRGKRNFDDVNYLAIEDSDNTEGFTRYYYVESVEYQSPNIAHIVCRLDVLMTYKYFIESMKCYLLRSGNRGDLYLPDDRPRRVYNNIVKMTFRDANDNVEGFVVPHESKADQRNNGFYVLSVLTAGYGPAEVS